ncbi:MAG: hypothetical protein AAF653_20640 [Chloroflexota bacterium]
MPYDPAFQNSFHEGISRFQNARMRAFWTEMIALMRGKPAELMNFEDIRARLRLSEESYRGLQDIPLEKIAGSVGRYRDFTSNFLPKKGKMQERWSRVYAQANSLSGLPPIEVYRVGDVYFVRDGNHRVSVARQLKSKTIQAHVTELRSPIALRPNMSDKELDSAAVYARFLAATDLRVTRPHHQILELSEPSRYGELMEHIHLHRNILEQVEQREVPLRDAAAHWYDNVYRPAVTLIRKYGVLDELTPKRDNTMRTETDLYLWMVGHLHHVREQFGPEATGSYSDALVDLLSENRMAVPKELLIENDEIAPITRTQVMRSLLPEDMHDDLHDEPAEIPVDVEIHDDQDINRR